MKALLMLPAAAIRRGGAFAACAGFGHGGALCCCRFLGCGRIRFCVGMVWNIRGGRYLSVGTANVARSIASFQCFTEGDGDLAGMQVHARPFVIFLARSRDENRLRVGTCASGQE